MMFVMSFNPNQKVYQNQDSLNLVQVKDSTWVDYQTGYASWYGSNGVKGIKHTDNYHGKKTASGEIFNTWEFTAAHKKLKFGTILKVTNLENDKFVIVRINDRGPYSKGRVIDLSWVAKQMIEMVGNVKVKLSILKTN
jgi:rare lipoprotein A